jgi:hypothetical protein
LNPPSQWGFVDERIQQEEEGQRVQRNQKQRWGKDKKMVLIRKCQWNWKNNTRTTMFYG